MNRFLAKKKAKDGDEQPPLEFSLSSQTSFPTTKPQMPPKKKSWRRKRDKQEPEPELDMSTVLPAADSFRTSLIMSGLSTRFSMLREQDDPRSLIGKASDDSVLQPKRRSRLGDFGYSAAALGDIAEDPSLFSHIRPPFGSLRNASYSHGDGYATDDDVSISGSIMTRARPGEGNMLFGGRQKIYRIPIGDAGAVNNLGSVDNRGMKGRALYEDDVSTSAFQRLREEEKAREREERMAEYEKEAELDDGLKDSLSAPSFTYNEKRETVSSTNSGPSMISQSTAATSVTNSAPASSPGLPSLSLASPTPPSEQRTKTRRLYEQGLDQHMQEQQSAAITRLTSVQRNVSTRGSSAPFRSRSAGNFRGEDASPGDNPIPPSFSSALNASAESTPPTSRPLSPEVLHQERDRALFNAIDPSRRGMATATGHFSKPKQFSEAQFLQRQMSLIQQQRRQRSSPSPRIAESPINDCSDSLDQDTHATRPRAATNRTDRSWSNASASNEGVPSTKPSSIDEEKASEEGEEEDGEVTPLTVQEVEPVAASGLTFLATDADDESDYESSSSTPADGEGTNGSGRLPPLDQRHPAMRSVTAPNLPTHKQKRNAWSPEALKSGLEAAGESPHDYFQNADSSEIGQHDDAEAVDDKADLKGLVRQHLRYPSNASSIYQPTRVPNDHPEFDMRVPSMYSTSNPWEQDDFPPPLPSERIDQSYVLQQSADDDEKIKSIPQPNEDWEQELHQHHIRGASTETAYERRAFESELAQRQRTIQENLRIKVENELKSPSPTLPGLPSAKTVFERPFGMMKSKGSKEAMLTPRDQPRPSLQGTRPVKETPAPTPSMGRTLHSKMPRQSEEGQATTYYVYSKSIRPSMDNMRPPRSGYANPPQSRGMQSRNAASNSSRTSSSRTRSGSGQSRSEQSREQSTSRQQSTDREGNERKASDPPVRPSLETRNLRRDSGNGRSPMSAPPIVETRSNDVRANAPPRQTFVPSSSNSARNSPIDSSRQFPSGYSSNSTPPLSQVSSPTINSNATSPSIFSQSSPGARELNGAPSTGFFFPPSANDFQGSKKHPPPPAVSSALRASRRKNTISKADISEPTFIASTSAINTVALPPRASLQNGLRDDFDVVLMGRDPSAAAPPPNIPTGETLKTKRPGFFKFGRKESNEKEQAMLGLGMGFPTPADEPEPRRFRIQRLENNEGRVGHRALREIEGENSPSTGSF